jgi:hypothetical protein
LHYLHSSDQERFAVKTLSRWIGKGSESFRDNGKEQTRNNSEAQTSFRPIKNNQPVSTGSEINARSALKHHLRRLLRCWNYDNPSMSEAASSYSRLVISATSGAHSSTITKRSTSVYSTPKWMPQRKYRQVASNLDKPVPPVCLWKMYWSTLR